MARPATASPGWSARPGVGYRTSMAGPGSSERRGPIDAVGEGPGRVNLIGDHTDYAEGLVLPLTLPLRTRVQLRRRPGSEVRVRTELEPGPARGYRLGEERAGGTWLDYIQGSTRALAQAGHGLGGVELDIRSTLPAGSGLASSAALTVALMRAFRQAFGLHLADLELARLARAAETDFVGAPVGPMDPLVASLGVAGEALFIDLRTLAVDRVALPSEVEVGVLHSGISHHNAGGTYAERRAEADAAARALGLRVLRDAAAGAPGRLEHLAPPLDRRARHVVTENARVEAFVRALRAKEEEKLGRLLAESHASLRDDYQVSHPDVDRLVALAQAEAHVLGARITGGGSGGAVVFLARAGRAGEAGGRIALAYRAQTGRPGELLVPSGPPGSPGNGGEVRGEEVEEEPDAGR